MNDQANPRLLAALLRAQHKRQQQLAAAYRRRELRERIRESMPRTWRDWLAFAACSAFGVLCMLVLLPVLAWWGALLW